MGCNKDKSMTGDICAFQGIRLGYSCPCLVDGEQCIDYVYKDSLLETWADIFKEVLEYTNSFTSKDVNYHLTNVYRSVSEYSKDTLIDQLKHLDIFDKVRDNPTYHRDLIERIKNSAEIIKDDREFE